MTVLAAATAIDPGAIVTSAAGDLTGTIATAAPIGLAVGVALLGLRLAWKTVRRFAS